VKPTFRAYCLPRLTSAVMLLIPGAAAAAEVHVMTSAGFYQAYSELAPGFERSSGHRLVTTRGPSLGASPEAIPTRLKRGEPADLVPRATRNRASDLEGRACAPLGTLVVRAASEFEAPPNNGVQGVGHSFHPRKADANFQSLT
jgi:hypothetical protein